MPKTKPFINGPQLGAGSLTIKPHKLPFEFTGTFNRPTKQLKRDIAAGITPSNGKAMNKGRLARRCLWPEDSVFELKFYHASRFMVMLSNKEKSGGNVGGNRFRNQFVITPHWPIKLSQPGSGFQKDIGNRSCILCHGLLNEDPHYNRTGMFFFAKYCLTSPTV